jgi:hypothetical protein
MNLFLIYIVGYILFCIILVKVLRGNSDPDFDFYFTIATAGIIWPIVVLICGLASLLRILP